MKIIEINNENKNEYNSVVTHPLQSYEWGEFREKTGVKVIRRGIEKNGKIVDGFALTIHKIPKTKFNIGYLPKGNKPTKEIIEELKKIGRENNCIFIQLEPNIEVNAKWRIEKGKFDLIPAARPLFTKHSFEINLEKSEEDLLKEFNSKTRYNIRLAEKKGVSVEIDNSEKAFKKYLELTNETTTRQNFYAHTSDYHKKMWETLRMENGPARQSPDGSSRMAGGEWKMENENKLSAHLLIAKFENEILTTWILFTFHDTLYYPYGASTQKHKNLMANNLVMWEAIRFGKSLGLKKFDLWGALGPDASENDPWYGFHKFKLGYNPRAVEFVGSFDLVINPTMYEIYKVADKLRWIYLRLKR